MNYTEITKAAIDYADRQDDEGEAQAAMSTFLPVVEGRINKRLRVQKQFCRAIIDMVEDQEYYGLPSDFATLRDIEFKAADGSGGRETPTYLNPEQMNQAVSGTFGQSSSSVFGPISGNALQTSGNFNVCAYTIIADQLQINPVNPDNVIEIVYAAKVPPLTAIDFNNWLSIQSPDIYIFGILVEIYAFVKDPAASQLWEQRFMQELDQLSTQDSSDRWSGPSLTIKVG